MYVRNARNREEVWLLDHIESMSLDDAAFRSRDYVIAIDEASDEKAGFGRLRVHRDGADGAPACELTGIGVLEAWRGQGVGAHVLERLRDRAADEGFATVFVFTDQPDYLAQFGFEPATDLPDVLETRLASKRESMSEAVPLRCETDEFAVPDRLRERFKDAAPARETAEVEASPEDFGIETENTTYKYDTG